MATRQRLRRPGAGGSGRSNRSRMLYRTLGLNHYLSATSMASRQFLPAHITPPKVLLLDVDCVNHSEITLDKFGNLRVHERETYCYISRGPLQPKALYELLRLGKLELLGLARKRRHVIGI